ncbi:S-methyl-5-thioribose-1-phosphate isomerase [candidate division KSB1 bacterium]|nr:MAG: S-methyl-5-thioribose-1-phosphate isomerase [candidate division KSB1 bacterium]
MIDQRRLPLEEKYQEYSDFREVAEAIKNMVIRGAPAIGVATAMGIALGASQIKAKSYDELKDKIEDILKVFEKTRPTAVNLFWSINRMRRLIIKNTKSEVEVIKELLYEESKKIWEEDGKINRLIGFHGAKLIKPKAKILTYCNAGSLATAYYGTALGVIRSAWEKYKNIEVFSCETRPYLQGARLTTWELLKDNIPVTLITDNTAGYVISNKLIDLIITGADRIAANGDTANKIGTYTLSVLAKENKIPFFVAAPTSTIDLSISSGKEIPIEQRDEDEVTHIFVTRIAPFGVKVINPAFDITPSTFILQ